MDEATEEAATGEAPRPRWRRILTWSTTALAVVLVLGALILPTRLSQVRPGAFLRIPVEGLLGVALVLVLPPKTRRVVAAIGGALLGLLTILRLINMGFYEVLDRPFDPVLDWPLLADAAEVVKRSLGTAAEIGAVIVAVVLTAAVLLLMTLAALRLTRLAVRYRTPAIRGVAVLGIAWATLATLGAQLVPGVPIAAKGAAGVAYYSVAQIPAGIRDRQAFTREASVDAYRDTPDAQLLTGLRGKDVLFAFVESYGRVAIEDPELAPRMTSLLDDGNNRLRAAGYAARTGWLTSPTFGGGSWLAHSTLLSGLWINNQQRYRNLLASDRLTLNRTFQRAGWRTVDVEPAVTRAWPEGAFYRSDKLYTALNLGYRGPQFTFGSIPDQYTLSAFQRNERAAPNHPPTMAEMVLLSSHTPWAPLPHLIDWASVGDGSVFHGMPETGDRPDQLRDRGRIRNAYLQSVQYSVDTLISYVLTYGGDNFVLVMLGDHQPAPIVAGEGASRDVPITVIAHDRTVLDRVSGWNWQDGLKPGPQTPVWRMDTFRDRFLTAFGSAPSPATPTR
ncbi:MAG: sulfatase [Actinobacteria bacterium 13_2_20CM_2_72_6]|nr:MAG: sulfatase [Actinobacteria bacterium 13_2_20CM_2_72_6]